MSARREHDPDPLTRASLTVAWVILANKPFYPLYVWWLVGSGVGASLATLVSVPFFLMIPLLAGRFPFGARLLLPLIGTLDTVLESVVFGRASATLSFLAPCMVLGIISFHPSEARWQRCLVGFIFICFVVAWHFVGTPIFPWDTGQLATLLNINVLAVGSLLTFIGWRYAGLRSCQDAGPPLP